MDSDSISTAVVTKRIHEPITIRFATNSFNGKISDKSKGTLEKPLQHKVLSTNFQFDGNNNKRTKEPVVEILGECKITARFLVDS